MTRRVRRRIPTLHFDGSDDKVVVAGDYTPSTTAFTVLFWYRPLQVTANDRIIDCQEAGPANGFALLHATTNNPNIQFSIRNAAAAEAAIISRQMVMGEMNLVCATYQVNDAKLYVNNTQDGNPDTSCTMGATTNPLTYGGRSGSAANFVGCQIGRVLVYHRVISQTEMDNYYYNDVAPSNPVIDHRLTEVSGSSIADSSGNAYTGTITGALFAPIPTRRWHKNVQISPSLCFDNFTSAVVTVPQAAALQPDVTQVFTWYAFVYYTDQIANVLPRLFNKAPHFNCIMGDATNGQFARQALETQNQSGAPDATCEFWGSIRLQQHCWYFLCTTFNQGSCQHWVNAIKDPTRIIFGSYTNMDDSSGANFLIGNREAGSRNTPGMWFGAGVHSVVLTDAEILQIYQGIPVTRGLVAKWNAYEGIGTSIADSSGNGHTGTLTSGAWV